MRKESGWGDINPGTNYAKILEHAHYRHPKDYPRTKKLSRGKEEKPLKREKIILLPEED